VRATGYRGRGDRPRQRAVWAEFEIPGPDGQTTNPDRALPLPRTGAELGRLVRAAALLVLVGGFLLILRRRIDGTPPEGTGAGTGE